MIIVDSDVVIDILRRFPPAIQWIATVRDPVCLPAYVAFELHQGCHNKKQMDALRQQISPFAILWPTEAMSLQALEVYSIAHLTHAMGILDALIAATALSYNLPLNGFNVKHFSAFPGLQVVQPYKR